MWCNIGLMAGRMGWGHGLGPFGPLLFILVLVFLAYLLWKKLSGPRLLKCPACKGPVQGVYLRCPHCGTGLKRHCPHCAGIIETGWKYCPLCEADVREDKTILNDVKK